MATKLFPLISYVYANCQKNLSNPWRSQKIIYRPSVNVDITSFKSQKKNLQLKKITVSWPSLLLNNHQSTVTKKQSADRQMKVELYGHIYISTVTMNLRKPKFYDAPDLTVF